ASIAAGSPPSARVPPSGFGDGAAAPAASQPLSTVAKGGRALPNATNTRLPNGAHAWSAGFARLRASGSLRSMQAANEVRNGGHQHLFGRRTALRRRERRAVIGRRRPPKAVIAEDVEQRARREPVQDAFDDVGELGRERADAAFVRLAAGVNF